MYLQILRWYFNFNKLGCFLTEVPYIAYTSRSWGHGEKCPKRNNFTLNLKI